MKEHQFINVKILSPSVSLVTLNRPEKRNALNIKLIKELINVFESLHVHTSERIVILNGEGTVFCAGLDLQEAADASLAEESLEVLSNALKTIYNSTLITIAAIHGASIAGGVGLMAACDLVLAAEKTQIGLPETRRGLVAALVAIFLKKQISSSHLRELLLLGELIDAEQAKNMGLVNRVVKPTALISEALKFADLILKGAPQATRETKRLLKALDPTNFLNELEIAKTFHRRARTSPEAHEGALAFLEKRPPKW